MANVPLQSTNLLDHANQKMGKHSIPKYIKKQVQEFSQGISSKTTKVQLLLQTHPKPNRNESNGEHSWPLVLIADGISW